MNNQAGFSVIETVLTVAIMAIVSVFSFPSIDVWKKNEQVRGEVRQITNSLMNAKFEAIKNNRYVVVQFQKSGYAAFVDDGAGGGKARDWIRQPGEREIVNHKIPGGLALTTNFPANRMRFKGRIGIRAGSVTLLRAGKKSAKVIVNLTGRVRVEKL